jgi:hypothetical protein
MVKHEDVCGPNGHLNDYVIGDDEPEVDSAKVQELRRELIQAKHHAEQMEARASENQKPATARRRKSDAA